MGHNNKNYSKFSEKKQVTEYKELTEKEVSELKSEDVIEVETEDFKECNELKGYVIECGKLNVRKEAKTDAEIIAVIDIDSEVKINNEESTEKFYKVCTALGIEGYCMKKYIGIVIE